MYHSTAKEMERLDELAVKNGLEIRQMMELAGWHMLAVFNELKISTSKKVVIVCGKGNKGGDGLSSARHLVNNGYSVSVVLVSREIKPDPEHHLKLLEKMNIPIVVYSDDANASKQIIQNSDIIIDALLGYHLDGNPRGHFAELINIINDSNKTTIAYDLPSGADATTGNCLEPCIKGDATLTLALPKKIFKAKEGKEKSGQVFLGDIGIPAFLYDKIKKDSRPKFNNMGIVTIE